MPTMSGQQQWFFTDKWMSLRDSSLFFCNTKSFNWGTLQSHANCSTTWADTDPFYLMYSLVVMISWHTPTRYFVCKGSMWNANCAQATANHFGKWMFLRNSHFLWQRMSHSRVTLTPIRRIYAECSTIWKWFCLLYPCTSQNEACPEQSKNDFTKACEFIIQILYISFLHIVGSQLCTWPGNRVDATGAKSELSILLQ